MTNDEEFTSHQIRDQLPTSVVYGASHQTNQRYVGNISTVPAEAGDRITCVNGKLLKGKVKV